MDKDTPVGFTPTENLCFVAIMVDLFSVAERIALNDLGTPSALINPNTNKENDDSEH